MKVLVIGSGGREHAICWKLKQSPEVEKLYCAPGNAGIAREAECVPIKADDISKLADFAEKNGIGFTVVGPEAPLCAGIADAFRSRGLVIFGPDKAAAELEGSKDFAKRFMLKYRIPTARSEVFLSAEKAVEYVKKEFASGEKSVVVKADGLAAGKGVLVAENEKDAVDFVNECFAGAFGSAGAKVLIEECLYGEEASIFALCDGKSIVPLASSQDHKRAYDFDRGPNTGGMGAYSPAPVVDEKTWKAINDDILSRFLAGVKAEKLDFRGVIFVGIMVTASGPKVLEFNVRFGDPETQPVMRRWEGDLCKALYNTATGSLAGTEIAWKEESSLSVVIASGGYPGKYDKGHPVSGLEEAEKTGCVVFHAGTGVDGGGNIVNTGGRVLGVCANGRTIREAIANAYAGVDKIRFEGCFCRRDIGAKALGHEKK